MMGFDVFRDNLETFVRNPQGLAKTHRVVVRQDGLAPVAALGDAIPWFEVSLRINDLQEFLWRLFSDKAKVVIAVLFFSGLEIIPIVPIVEKFPPNNTGFKVLNYSFAICDSRHCRKAGGDPS
jgi:hypothetical protein